MTAGKRRTSDLCEVETLVPTRSTRQRSLYAYSIHGRSGDTVIDYHALFHGLSLAPSIERQTGVGDEVVAVTVVRELPQSRWALRFVSGRSGMPPLFYDPVTATESTADLGNRFVATASWAFVDPATRIVAAERTRPGVPVALMARGLAHLGRELNLVPELVIDLNPIPSPGFIREAERFARFRLASVVLARPNYSWTDNASVLSGYAGESNAASVDVTMSAPRAQSLSTEAGIIPDIKSLASDRVGPLKDLRITGTREGESKETTVSLAKHQEKRFVPVEIGADPVQSLAALDEAAARFLDELSPRDGDALQE